MVYKTYFTILFFLSFIGFGQITNNGENITPQKETTSKKLVLKNKNNIVYIEQNQIIEVYFKDSIPQIKGKLIILNDSIIELNNTPIHLSEINKIQTNLKTRNKGVVLSVFSAALIGSSIYTFNLFVNSSTFYELLSYGAMTVASGSFGLGLIAPSIILLDNKIQKKYNVDKWSFYIK